MRLERVGYGAATCVGFWRWKVKALIRQGSPRGSFNGWLNQNAACTSHWIRLIRKEQGMYRPLIGRKQGWALFPFEKSLQKCLLILFITGGLSTWQSSMGSLKGALPLTEGMHCLHAAKIEPPLMFQISPPFTSLSPLFIYLLPLPLIYLCLVVPRQMRTDGSRSTTQRPWKVYMNIYYGTTSEPDRPVAVKAIVRR